MSKTIVDMPKVTQMMDAGWIVRIYKGSLGSYEVRASHPNPGMRNIVRGAIASRNPGHVRFKGMTLLESVEEYNFDDGELITDDFTPERALTRMAYKVFGEII